MSLFNKDKNKQELTASGCSDFLFYFGPNVRLFPVQQYAAVKGPFFIIFTAILIMTSDTFINNLLGYMW